MALPSAAVSGKEVATARACGGQHAVGPAEHGILLVQHGREAGALGGIDRRHRGIAAEAHDEGRAQTDHEAARLEIAPQELRDALGAAQQAAAGKPRRRDAEDLDRRQAVAEAAAAAVGDQDHAPAAVDEGAGQRLRRKHMAAGAPGGEQDRPCGLARGGHEIPPGPKRRRDRARSMPMASARASSEEPP